MENIVDNKQNFENIYRMYYKRMFGLCMKYVNDRNVAEDLVQDSFVIILTNIDKLKDTAKLESWMFSIAKNTCLKYLEKKKLFSDINIGIDTVADLQEDLSEHLSDDIISYDTIMKMVDSLPEGYKKVFKLYNVDGLSHEEIAKQLNISPKTSSSQLHRAKKTLKRMILSYWTLGVISVMLIVLIIMKFFIGNEIPTDNNILVKVKNSSSESIEKTVLKGETTVNFQDITKGENKTPFRDSQTLFYGDETPFGERETTFYFDEKSNDKNDSLFEESVPNSDSKITTNNDYIQPKNNNIYVELHQDNIIKTHENNMSLKSDIILYIPNEKLLTYNVIHDNTEIGLLESFLPNDDISGNFIAEKEHCHYPATMSLMFVSKLNKYFSIDYGFQYTFMKTDLTFGSDYSLSYRLQYAGVRTQLAYHYIQTKFLDIYAGIGGSFEVPVYHKGIFYQENSKSYHNIKTKSQFSISVSNGFNSDIIEKIGVFVQPQINYFFDNGDKIPSYRKKHKMNAELHIGIRINL